MKEYLNLFMHDVGDCRTLAESKRQEALHKKLLAFERTYKKRRVEILNKAFTSAVNGPKYTKRLLRPKKMTKSN